MLTTILSSIDTFVIIATTSTSITLGLTGFGLIVIPISSSIACGLTISNKVIYEIIIQKQNEYKKQKTNMKNTNKLLKFLTNFFKKSLQYNVIVKSEYECLCGFFTK